MSPKLSPDISRLQAALVRYTLEDTRQGFFATDERLRVVVWNRWMEVHSGRRAPDVIGRPLLELYPDIEERGIREYYDAALDGRVTILSHGLHQFIIALPPTHTGLGLAHMPQTGSINPLIEGGGVVGTITAIEDVSERLARERALRQQIEAQRQARATAEEALRAKDEFLSTMSHEMRTPLNAVLGWAKILLARKQLEPELLERALHVIERNAAAQARMIDDMLDVARISAGKLRLEMQPVDLLGVLLAAIDVIMPAAQAKRVSLRTSLDPATPQVLGDPDRLQQVTWNLLSNALKFTDAGGTVEVRLESSFKAARIVVADSGCGIAPEFLPFVFERFRQADTSSGRRHGGLGLGLALVRDLVALHGGTVRAESAGAGKGATFTIELPAVLSPEIRRNHLGSEGIPADAISSLTGVRVLVVDDETDARELAVTTLQHCGATVRAVSSGAEALDVLLSSQTNGLPDVIVSDIGMPHEDGYQVIRRLRAMPSAHATIPAVAVTGYATAEDIERVLAAGFQRHVAKPIDPATLVTAIAELVKRV